MVFNMRKTTAKMQQVISCFRPDPSRMYATHAGLLHHIERHIYLNLLLWTSQLVIFDVREGLGSRAPCTM